MAAQRSQRLPPSHDSVASMPGVGPSDLHPALRTADPTASALSQVVPLRGTTLRAAVAFLTVLVFGASLSSLPSSAADLADDPRWHEERLYSSAGPLPDDATLMQRGAVIGEVFIQTGDIFDPEKPDENRFLFRLANRMHITTQEAVVERKLLFRQGDPYDPRVLAETARYLRSLDYLYDATIEPIRVRGNRVDVLVSTRDVWTLGLGAGFKRTGGANTFQAHIEESNLLGTGRFLDLKYADDPDRSSSRLRYIDQALFDTRTEMRLWYADNSDGHRQVVDIERPFFSLDTRWSAGVKLISDERTERIYSQGEIINRFVHESERAEIRGGLSKGYRDGRTRRWLAGYTFERSRFRSTVSEPPNPFEDPPSIPHGTGGGSGYPAGIQQPSVSVPLGRELSYFWVGFEQIEDGFVTLQNMDQINRTEDFNFGHELSARLGWSAPAWGGDESQAILDARARAGWNIRERQNLFVDGWASGRWGSSGHENVFLGAELRYYFRNFGKHRLHATVRADAAWNLDPEKQLLLGGDSGLRGYPRRFQDGDRRFLVSLEQRFYTNWELFNLVHVGAAIFVDAGRAWTDDGSREDLGVLTDVGFGLRLGSSRSAKGQMVHLDVAFPLDADGDTDSIQWLVTTHRSF